MILGVLLLISSAVSAVVINEFVADPVSDWDGDGNVFEEGDEWVELLNGDAFDVDVTNWSLMMVDGSVSITSLNGTIAPNGYLVILNPSGSQSNSGRIVLLDENGSEVDSVTFGNWDDGNVGDNAPGAESIDPADECLARFPDGSDSDVDNIDFVKTSCTYGSSNEYLPEEIEIVSNPPSPDCVAAWNDIIISANVTGGAEFVGVEVTINGTQETHEINSSVDDVYSRTISKKDLVGGAQIEWTFFAENSIGEITYGELNSFYVIPSTSLISTPSEPNGENGWYVSQPHFEIFNYDAIDLFYQWDSLVPQSYSEGFGIEGAGASVNVTAGVQSLKWWGEFVCGTEPKQNATLYFDFSDPEIKNIEPSDESFVYENPVIISALLDDVYQSNSGIDENSVVLMVDGEVVSPDLFEISAMKTQVSYSGELENGLHTVYLFVEDNAGRNSERYWTFESVDLGEFSMMINSPVGGITSEKKVNFNISLSREADKIEYMDAADARPRWKRLCSECDSYGLDKSRVKSLREGTNELVFRAHDPMGGSIEESVRVIVDSKAPKIIETSPENGFANGVFKVTFDEENPVFVELFYGDAFGKWKNKSFNISECSTERHTICSVETDLSEFEGGSFGYYIAVTDVAGQVSHSDTATLQVDTSVPLINSVDYSIDGKSVTFTLNISEPYLKEVTYIEETSSRPIEKKICTKLQDGLCVKKVSFSDGDHHVVFYVRDAGGAVSAEEVNFFTDSNKPRIVKTYPRGGFATGRFEVDLEEENAEEVLLNYGSKTVNLNLTECLDEGRRSSCGIDLDLSDFDGEDIAYWFKVIDRVGNFDESDPVLLTVDMTPPSVSYFNYSVDGKKVLFDVNVEDTHLDKVEYIDLNDRRPAYKVLCGTFDDGNCARTKSFGRGAHKLTLRAVDDAGNVAVVAEDIEFVID